MAIADEVFSGVATEEGSVVRIENLEIDLGRIPARAYYEHAEERFRERLSEALWQTLRKLNVEAGRAPGSPAESNEGTLSAADRELEIVSAFLERGYLPWNVRTLSGEELEAMLRRTVAAAGTQLATRLRATADRDALSTESPGSFRGTWRCHSDRAARRSRGPAGSPGEGCRERSVQSAARSMARSV